MVVNQVGDAICEECVNYEAEAARHEAVILNACSRTAGCIESSNKHECDKGVKIGVALAIKHFMPMLNSERAGTIHEQERAAYLEHQLDTLGSILRPHIIKD